MALQTTHPVPHLTERQPLRRATYVHVSDLISAYNIDHVQLEREIARVNSKRSKNNESDANSTTTTPGAESDKGKKVPSGIVCENTKNVCRDSNSDSVPSPDEDTNPEGPTVPQKRLQPPRGGFNLCV